MASNWEKFKLLFWKNWLIQWRNKVQSAVEVLLPAIFCSILLIIRALVSTKRHDDPTFYNPLPLNTVKPIQQLELINELVWEFAYSPKNEELEKLLESAVEYLNTTESIAITGKENSTSLTKYLTDSNILVGVEFSESYKNLTQMPEKLDFTLRFPNELRTNSGQFVELFNWFTSLIFPFFQESLPRNQDKDDGGIPPGYYSEGFLTIQNAISRAFIERFASNESSIPEIQIQRFPYPPYTSDRLLIGLEALLPLIMINSFLYVSINTVKFITVEKEKQLKEAMKIMGLPNWLHWTAWFTKSLIFLVMTITLIVFMLKLHLQSDSNAAIFTNSSWFVIWLFFFCYAIATIMFCFMVSVFFTKANTASMVSGLLWFLSYTPFAIAAEKYDTLQTGQKTNMCFLSNSAMSIGVKLIMRHEGTGFGLQFHNLFEQVTVDDEFTVGKVMVMFLVDSVIYGVVTWYVEKINPGSFGVPELPYFPFTVSYWRGDRKVDNSEPYLLDLSTNTYMEPEPMNKIAGIEIRGLRKEYSNKKIAVHGLSMKMYEDEITVLLGHNGAGKTTTMSMLTGMFPPTSGTALIDGKDIRRNINGVRESLGLCPQHDILFDELTVAEHITFFARLKGLSYDVIRDEIDKYVGLMELESKRNAMAGTLSGGMKRKLSVGIALCGSSRVVLLDEPTSGMDPTARRSLWDLLIKEKQGRTILLSTHFMDEADVLGDKIAIMAEGELKCAGSPFFLKKKFGVGYRLVCVKGMNCKPKEVTEFLQRHISDIGIDTDIGSELSYILNENYRSDFKTILEDFENNSESLGITSYGISLTTMEEVFLRVGSDSDPATKLDEVTEEDSYMEERSQKPPFSAKNTVERIKSPLVTGRALWLNQILAMLIKKTAYSRRTWIPILIQNIMPIIAVMLTFMDHRTRTKMVEPVALEIGLGRYAKTVTILEKDSQLTSEEEMLSSITDSYQSLFNGIESAHRLIDLANETFPSYILRFGSSELSLVNTQYMVAASITRRNLTAWFNNQALHTAPLSISLLQNAILRTYCPTCAINIVNKPLPFSSETRRLMLKTGGNIGFGLALNSAFIMALLAAYYVLFPVKDRVSKSKLLQFVSGVNPYIYWLISFFWDYLTFFVTGLIYILTIASYQEEGWSTFTELGRILLIFAIFIWAVIPMTYLLSLKFDIPSSGYSRLTMFYIFTGMLSFMFVFIMGFDIFDLKDIQRILTWIFMMFPHFAFAHGVNGINTIQGTYKICKAQCEKLNGCSMEIMCAIIPGCCQTDCFFDWNEPGIGRNVVFMLLCGAICMAILLALEVGLFDFQFRKGKSDAERLKDVAETEEAIIDSDVQAEKSLVRSLNSYECERYSLVLKDLTKFYKKFLAVKKLCVAIRSSECFGLLGVNGAGKTTTFKMLTGDHSITAGDAWVKGTSLRYNMKGAQKLIGYCPQFDAVLEDLTGHEILEIFCLLKGIPPSKLTRNVYKMATELNFMKHLDKQVKNYSGGNRRKLSTALALIGDPDVVYLDEPTTGMDPGAKRQLWDVICKVRDEGKSIVLTSHSMEECEALCTRLAIMVNGEFKCLGSTQHLKNKFSKGFVLTIKLKRDTLPISVVFEEMPGLDKIKNFVAEKFSESYLKEEHLDTMVFHIPSRQMKWSEIFGLLEDAKADLNIEDYSLLQTSLEQVFLFFTKYQREESASKSKNHS